MKSECPDYSCLRPPLVLIDTSLLSASSWFNAMRRVAVATGMPVVESEFDSLTEDDAAAVKEKVRR